MNQNFQLGGWKGWSSGESLREQAMRLPSRPGRDTLFTRALKARWKRMGSMSIEVEQVPLETILPLRELYRREMNCQIIHDSLPRRGFGNLFQIREGGQVVGYGFVMGYQDEPKDMIREFFILPSCRGAAQPLFRQLITASQARRIFTQSNDILLTLMLYDCATQITSETILFHDALTSHLSVPGVVYRPVGPDDEGKIFEHKVEPLGDWALEREGVIVATGGILTHYNPPYGDLYMEVEPSHRRQGLGGYLIQELKRTAYATGRVPAARCNVENTASRTTLQKARLLPCARLLSGVIGPL
jgi:GNAT superfamily N-acetyltransferase